MVIQFENTWTKLWFKCNYIWGYSNEYVFQFYLITPFRGIAGHEYAPKQNIQRTSQNLWMDLELLLGPSYLMLFSSVKRNRLWDLYT